MYNPLNLDAVFKELDSKKRYDNICRMLDGTSEIVEQNKIIHDLFKYSPYELFLTENEQKFPRALGWLKEQKNVGSYSPIDKVIWGSRDIDIKSKTNMIRILMEYGNHPLLENKYNENSFMSLINAVKRGVVTIDGQKKIIDVFYSPPNNAIKKMVKYNINRLSQKNTNKLAPQILFLFALNPEFTANEVFTYMMMTKKTQRDIVRGTYDSVKNIMGCVLRIFQTKISSITGSYFFDFFERNRTVFSELHRKYQDNLIKLVRNTNLEKESNTDILGAIVGEIVGDIEPFTEYYKKHPNICITAIAHKNVITDKQLRQFGSDFKTMTSHDRVLVMNVIENITKKSVYEYSAYGFTSGVKHVDKAAEAVEAVEDEHKTASIHYNKLFIDTVFVSNYIRDKKELVPEDIRKIKAYDAVYILCRILNDTINPEQVGYILHIVNWNFPELKLLAKTFCDTHKHIYDELLEDNPKWIPELLSKLAM